MTKHPRRIALQIGAPLLIVVLLNLGLYSQLAPRPPESLYRPPHRASLIDLSLQDWIVLSGRWQRRDLTLAQESEQTDDFGIVAPLRMPPGDTYRFSTDLWLEQAAMGAGILFDLQRPTSRQQGQIVRLGRDQQGTFVLCGYFDDNNTLQVQANQRVADQPDLSELGLLTVVVSPTTYSVMVGDQTVAQDLARVGSGGWIGLEAQSGPVVFSDAQVELLASEAAGLQASLPTSTPILARTPPAATMRLPYQAALDVNPSDSDWISFGGIWTADSGTLTQGRTDESDDGITAANVPPEDRYTIRARFRHLQGVGAGIVFGVPARDSRNGAQIVRYSGPANGLVWGFLDAQGAWHGQGQASVQPPGQDAHTLEVGLQRDSYAIRLDGQTLALGIPRVSQGGYFGLTTSFSSVAFESFEVLPASDFATRLGSGPLTDARILSGDWAGDGETIRQRSATPADLVLDTGLTAGRQYQVDVNVDASGAVGIPASGGGVLLGMSGTDSWVGAHLVRITDGGRSALWGYFAADGSFVGQGSAQIQDGDQTPHALSVVVNVNTFDVSIDGRRVAARIPLRRQGGGIGLLSFGGPVAFTGFALSPSGAP